MRFTQNISFWRPSVPCLSVFPQWNEAFQRFMFAYVFQMEWGLSKVFVCLSAFHSGMRAYKRRLFVYLSFTVDWGLTKVSVVLIFHSGMRPYQVVCCAYLSQWYEDLPKVCFCLLLWPEAFQAFIFHCEMKPKQKFS